MNRKKEIEKNALSEICFNLGCSGLDKKCPGNPRCDILRKIIKKMKREA